MNKNIVLKSNVEVFTVLLIRYFALNINKGIGSVYLLKKVCT